MIVITKVESLKELRIGDTITYRPDSFRPEIVGTYNVIAIDDYPQSVLIRPNWTKTLPTLVINERHLSQITSIYRPKGDWDE